MLDVVSVSYLIGIGAQKQSHMREISTVQILLSPFAEGYFPIYVHIYFALRSMCALCGCTQVSKAAPGVHVHTYTYAVCAYIAYV